MSGVSIFLGITSRTAAFLHGFSIQLDLLLVVHVQWRDNFQNSSKTFGKCLSRSPKANNVGFSRRYLKLTH